MVSTYTVSMTAKVDGHHILSKVATLSLTSDFVTVFKNHADEEYELINAFVASGPHGPWQSVDVSESTSVLRDLSLRHILC